MLPLVLDSVQQFAKPPQMKQTFFESAVRIRHTKPILLSSKIEEVEHVLTPYLQHSTPLRSNWQPVFGCRYGIHVRPIGAEEDALCFQANRRSPGRPNAMKLSAESHSTTATSATPWDATKRSVGEPISKDTIPRRIRRPRYIGAATLDVAAALVAEDH